MSFEKFVLAELTTAQAQVAKLIAVEHERLLSEVATRGNHISEPDSPRFCSSAHSSESDGQGVTAQQSLNFASLLRSSHSNGNRSGSNSPRKNASDILDNIHMDQRAQNFEPWSFWKEQQLMEKEMSSRTGLLRSWARRRSQSYENLSTVSSSATRELYEGETRFQNYFGQKFKHLVIHPSSKKRLAWDLIGMLCIVYDTIAIPLQVFGPEETFFTEFMMWFLRIYWSMDLPSCFATGYLQGGALHMNIVRITRRYLTTWFPLDLFLVVLNWLLLITHTDDENDSSGNTFGLARLGKTFRVFRILRVLRLLRLIKMPKYFVQIEERIQSEQVVVVLRIMRHTASILVINHMIACVWYAIGNADRHGQKSWVRKYDFNGTSIEDRYTVSLHWSLTQFTPASMDVFPQNVYERAYALLVLVFAMIAFSTFISSITNSMTHLRNMNSEYAKQLVFFQRYVQNHNISTQLTIRMRRHLEHRILRGKQAVDERHVALLTHLSEPLRMELHLEVYSPVLNVHPFFDKYCEMHPVAMRKMCHSAMVELPLSQGDVLFSSGETCERMYFFKAGAFRYLPDSGVEDVPSISWFCEHCFWTSWRHVGRMYTATKSFIVGVEALKFLMVVRTSRCTAMNPSNYALRFVEYLNTLGEEELSDLDLEGFDRCEAIEGTCITVSTPDIPDSVDADFAGLGGGISPKKVGVKDASCCSPDKIWL